MTQAVRAGDLTGPEGFLETGVAYIEWALAHPAYFQVMFRPELVDEEDPTLTRALSGLADALMLGAAAFSGSAQRGAPATNPLALAAWSLTHGYATLALAGNLPTGATEAERAELIRSVLRHLAPA